jgi:hypothetical protein
MIVVGWLLGSSLIGWLAASRGRNPGGWFFLALLISPLLSAVFLMVLPNLITDFQDAGVEPGTVKAPAANEFTVENLKAELLRIKALQERGLYSVEEAAARRLEIVHRISSQRICISDDELLMDLVAVSDAGLLSMEEVKQIKEYRKSFAKMKAA